MLSYSSQGEGAPPIVFVHGIGGARDDWADQLTHFSPAHFCVAVDLPAHGASQAKPLSCSVEGYAAEVARVLQDLRLKWFTARSRRLACPP